MLMEFKKLFSSKMTWIALIMTLAYMFYLSYGDWKFEGKPDGEGKRIVEFADEISGSYDEINKSLEAYNEETATLPSLSEEYFERERIYYQLSQLASYVFVDFPEHRTKTVTEIFYAIQGEKRKDEPDSYFIKYNEKAFSLYNKRVPLEFKSTGISNHTYEMFYIFSNFSYWEEIMLAFTVIITVRMFTMDRTSGAYQIVNTSRKNSRGLFIKKIAAVSLVCFFVRAIHFAVQMFFGMRLLGLSNLYLPLQQFEIFEECPWQISIAGFTAVQEAAVMLMYLVFIAVIALISIAVLNPLVSLIIGLGLCEGGFIFYKYNKFEIVDAANKFRTYVPHALMSLREYFEKFDYFNFFGIPVSRLIFCMAFTAFIGAAALAAGYALSGRGKR